MCSNWFCATLKSLSLMSSPDHPQIMGPAHERKGERCNTCQTPHLFFLEEIAVGFRLSRNCIACWSDWKKHPFKSWTIEAFSGIKRCQGCQLAYLAQLTKSQQLFVLFHAGSYVVLVNGVLEASALSGSAVKQLHLTQELVVWKIPPIHHIHTGELHTIKSKSVSATIWEGPEHLLQETIYNTGIWKRNNELEGRELAFSFPGPTESIYMGGGIVRWFSENEAYGCLQFAGHVGHVIVL